jgi:PBP1b-binding outer membrane lipoprotein LpoB
MNTKKMLSIVAISCSLLFLAGCGGAKTADVSTGTVPTVTEDTQMPNVPGTKNATKDQCIEMMAYAFKFSQDQAQ